MSIDTLRAAVLFCLVRWPSINLKNRSKNCISSAVSYHLSGFAHKTKSFLSCYKVSYVTDADWRHIENVKDMKGGQLGYFGQKIEVTEYENEKFICASIDLVTIHSY